MTNTAELLEAAAQRIEAKLAGTTFQALEAVWSQWEPDCIKAFHATLVDWHKGTDYMHKDEDDFVDSTPFDKFSAEYPEQWQAYADTVAAGAPKIELFRSVLFEQADRIVDAVIEEGSSYRLDDLWYALEMQNELSFGGRPVSNESATDYNVTIGVRRFSSWTSKAYVAYKLTLEGGMYQIGNGGVIVRTSANPRVVHTFDSAVAFEKWCAKNKEKAEGCTPFMREWTWQLEYVVESTSGSVPCDGIIIVGQEGAADDDDYGYYERISKATGHDEDDDD